MNKSSQVTHFIQSLNHPFEVEIDLLRELMLGLDATLTENIKWNGPNYCIDGEDRITMRIQPPKHQVQLIFHRGAKKLVQSENRLITFESEILAWKDNDRAIVTFNSQSEIEKNQVDLVKIIQLWLEATKINSHVQKRRTD